MKQQTIGELLRLVPKGWTVSVKQHADGVHCATVDNAEGRNIVVELHDDEPEIALRQALTALTIRGGPAHETAARLAVTAALPRRVAAENARDTEAS